MKISDGDLEIRIKQMEAMITREECKRDDIGTELSIIVRDIRTSKNGGSSSKRNRSSGSPRRSRFIESRW